MKNSKVSIVIPVYNGANFMREAIDSALAQTYSNFEVIVVNDGSKDNGTTDRIAKSYGRKIRYFKKENGGVSTALNLALEKMSGEYFSWLSHDDLYLPEKLETQIKFINENKISSKTIIYSDYILIDPKGNQFAVSAVKSVTEGMIGELLAHSFVNGCSLLVPKLAFKAAGNFDKKWWTTQDYQMWFRCVKVGYSFRKCPGALIKSRQHPGQDSLTLKDSHKTEKDDLGLWVFKNFTARQIFGSHRDYASAYLNLSVALKANGCSKSAQKARSIVLVNSGLNRYGYLFKYNLFLPSVRIIQNLFGSASRFAMRKMVGLMKKYFYQEPRIYNGPPLKICLIGDLSSIHSLKYIDYLKSQHFEIHFITTHMAKVSGIKIYDLSRRKFELVIIWAIRLVVTTRRLVKKINPHVVHGRYLVPCGVLAYLSGFNPYIVAAWGSDILKTPWLVRGLVKKTLTNAALVIGTSEQLVKACLENGSSRYKTHLIRIGVDLNIFKSYKVDQLRRKLKLENKKVILSPRSIDHIYNNKMIVEAYNLIPDKENLILAMIDLPYNPGYAQKVKKYIKDQNLEDKVIFLPAVPNHKMADYYNLADVIVSFASSDGFSICILEGLACEKRVVMSDLPNLDEAWSKKLGFWKSKIEARFLSKALVKSLKIPQENFVRIGRENRRLVKENANLKTCFNKMNDLYMQIVRK